MLNKSVNTIIKDVDGNGRVVVAANAFGNVDAQKDISMPGSFDKTIKENFGRVKWFLNHDTNKLLGVPLQAIATQQYLEITGQLNLNKDIGRDTYEDYKLYAEYGKSLEHSIGVDAIKFADDQGLRKVSEWKLWEYSTLTAWGANDNTPMLAIKSGNISGAIDWLNIRMRKGDYTDETFEKIDKALNNLKSLIAEPDTSTQNAQPILISDMSDISTQFLKSLNN